MEVILLEDVKGKGLMDEILDLPGGYANFLIREGKAVIKTKESMKALQLRKEKRHQELVESENKAKQIVREIKDKYNGELVFNPPLTPRGTLRNPITKRDILDALNVDGLTSKNLIMDKITTNGNYNIPIEIHYANGTLYTLRSSILVKVGEE